MASREIVLAYHIYIEARLRVRKLITVALVNVTLGSEKYKIMAGRSVSGYSLEDISSIQVIVFEIRRI